VVGHFALFRRKPLSCIPALVSFHTLSSVFFVLDVQKTNAQSTTLTAESACNAKLEYWLSGFYSYWSPICECSDNLDATYGLTCETDCEQCADSFCYIIKGYKVFDQTGVVTLGRECTVFTQGMYSGSEICYEETTADSEGCRVSVNDQDCISCNIQLCDTPTFSENRAILDCTNIAEIGFVLDQCDHDTGYDVIALQAWASEASSLGRCNLSTKAQALDPPIVTTPASVPAPSSVGEPATSTQTDPATGSPVTSSSESEAACLAWLDDRMSYFDNFGPICECTDNLNGTYTMTCQNDCELCEDSSCALFSKEVLFSSLGIPMRSFTCINFTSGADSGKEVCFKVDDLCLVVVDGQDCNECLFQYCVTSGDDGFVVDCTNIVDVGTVVNTCTDTGLFGYVFENERILPYSASIGRCNLGGGQATQLHVAATTPAPVTTAPDPSEPTTPPPTDQTTLSPLTDPAFGSPEISSSESEAACRALLEYQMSHFEDFGSTCECIDNLNDTYTMACQNDCELCEDSSCALFSKEMLFSSLGIPMRSFTCVNFTSGTDSGKEVCEEWISFNAVCRLVVNGQDCNTCDLQSCEASVDNGFIVDCANVDEVGTVVNTCIDTSFVGYVLEIQRISPSSASVGRCNLSGSLATQPSIAATTLPPPGTSEPVAESPASSSSEAQAAWVRELGKDLSYFEEYAPTCECIDNRDGTYNLTCQNDCEECEESSCFLSSTWSFFDDRGVIMQGGGCVKFTTGAYTGEEVCFSESVSECSLTVNGQNCSTCEFQHCEGTDGDDILADCTNVAEIGTVVNMCAGVGVPGIVLELSRSDVTSSVGRCGLSGSQAAQPPSHANPVSDSPVTSDSGCDKNVFVPFILLAILVSMTGIGTS